MKNNKLIWIIGIVLVVILMNNQDIKKEGVEIAKGVVEFSDDNWFLKLGSSSRTTQSSCQSASSDKEDSGKCVSNCYELTESLMKCNTYWAVKNGHREGYGYDWYDDQDYLGKWFFIYADDCPPYSSDWSQTLYDCSTGTLSMPPHPKCVDNSDCNSGEMCDLSTLVCVGDGTCDSSSCNQNDGWYCDYSDDEVYRDYYCDGNSCVFTESQKLDCGGSEWVCDGVDKVLTDDYCDGTTGRCAYQEISRVLCNNGCESGECIPDQCIPDCYWSECGDDGCGGSCGTCSTGQICEDGDCVPGSCTPDNSCVATTCIGQSCTDECGNVYDGTKVCSCTPDCSSASNFAVGETFPDGCGGVCQGTGSGNGGEDKDFMEEYGTYLIIGGIVMVFMLMMSMMGKKR